MELQFHSKIREEDDSKIEYFTYFSLSIEKKDTFLEMREGEKRYTYLRGHIMHSPDESRDFCAICNASAVILYLIIYAFSRREIFFFRAFM